MPSDGLRMIKFWAKLLRNGKILRSDTYDSACSDFSDALLDALTHFCKQFDIETPMWSTQHTKQMGMFRKAVFRKDDFIDQFAFDRFELQILEDEKK